MSDKEVRIKIKVGSEYKEATLLKKEVDKISNSFNTSEKSANSFYSTLGNTAKVLTALVAIKETLIDTARHGVDVNRTYEKLENSLSAVTFATSKNIDSLGNHLTLTQKQTKANIEAEKTIQKLLVANLKTPHTLDQTVKLYDSMSLGMKKLGATTEDMVEITQKLSIAVGDKIGFDAMLSAMDGLSTGTVEVASDMGRWLKSIGLSNEAIKESTNVVELFKEKLSGFRAVDSFDTRLSNLTNSYDTLAKTISEPIFENLKDDIISASNVLTKLNDYIVDFKNNIDSVDDVAKINEISILEEQAKEIGKEWRKAEDIITGSYENIFSLFASKKMALSVKTDAEEKLQAINERIKELRKELEKNQGELVYDFDDSEIQKVINETLKPYETGLAEINNKWQVHYDLMKKNGKDTSLVLKAWKKEVSEYDEKILNTTKNWEKHTDAIIESNEEMDQANEDLYTYKLELQQEVFENQLLLDEAWMIERERLEEEMASNGLDIESALAKEKIAISKKEYFDKFKKETKNLYTYTETTFDEMSKSMYQSMDDNLFSKWDSWMDSVFDDLGMFGDILSDALAPVGRNLSSSIAQYLTPITDNVTTVDTTLLNGLGFDRNDNGSYRYDTGSGVIEVNSSGLVTQGASLLNATSGPDGQSLTNLLGLGSNLNSAYSFITNPAAMLYAPSMYMGQAAGTLYGAGYTTAGNFLAGGANVLGGGSLAGTTGATLYGGLATAGIAGGLGGYVVGSLGDALFGANTYAGEVGAGGGAIGAMIGSVVPGIGTLVGGAVGSILGSVIGGVFGKKSVVDTGLKVFDTMYADNVSNEMVNAYTRYKKKSWFGSKSWDVDNELTLTQLNQIEGLFTTIDNLTSIMGGVGTLSVGAGKYSKDSLTNELIPQYLIAEAMGYDIGTLTPETFDLFENQGKEFNSKIAFAIAQGMKAGDDSSLANPELENLTYEEYLAQYGLTDLQKIHNDMVDKIGVIFEDWESVVEDGESVIEVMGEYISKFQTTVRDFKIYNAADEIEKLRLQQEFAVQDLELLAKAAGVNLAEITVENFEDKYKEAIQNDFTQSNIDNWESLGDALMSATDAEKAYKNALEQTRTTVNQNAQNLISSYTSVFDTIDNIISSKTFTYADYDLNDLSVDNASSYISAFQTVQQNELTSLTNQYNTNRSYLVQQLEAAQAEKETRLQTLQSDYETRRQSLLSRKETIYDESEALKDTFEDIADSLDDTYASIIKQTDFGSTFVVDQYNDLYTQMKTGIEAGTDVSGLTSEFNTYANEYADYIANTALTKTEYEEKMLTLANEVKGLAGSSRAVTLADINDTFVDELENIDASLSSLDSSFAASIAFASSRSDAKLESINSDISLLDNTFETQIQTVNDTFTNEILGLKNVLRELFAKDAQNYLDDNSNYLSDENLSALNNVTYSGYVDQAYMDVLGRSADNAGKEYWVNELENGNIKLADLYKALIYGAKDEDIQAAQNYLSLHPFADGGLVRGGMGGVPALIGEKDYDELITPLDGRDALGIQALVAKIEELTGQMDRLSQINATQAEILSTLVTKNNVNYTKFNQMLTELKRIG